MRIVFILLAVTLGFSAWAQQPVRAYLFDGREFDGVFFALTDSQLILTDGTGLYGVHRSKVKRIAPTPKLEVAAPRVVAPSLTPPKPSLPYKPFARRNFSEFDVGLTYKSPFTMHAGYTVWHAFDRNWQAGVGTSLNIFRFAMLSANFKGRYIVNKGTVVKPFAEGGLGLSYFEHQFLPNWGIPFDYEFTRVKNASLGGGLLIDTGMGIAFTAKAMFSYTWFSLIQYPSPTYTIEADYYIGTAIFAIGMNF